MCDAFAVLSAKENVLINQSKLNSINETKEAFSYMMGYCNFVCKTDKVGGQKFALNAIVNMVFNNKRKISTASVRKNNAASFQKQIRKT